MLGPIKSKQKKIKYFVACIFIIKCRFLEFSVSTFWKVEYSCYYYISIIINLLL